ncbi:MAG: DUF349 domain-containing protein [Bacteroidales bacterium]|nr:DUF349 domain-containing protein [Bacteroidales bacterium]
MEEPKEMQNEAMETTDTQAAITENVPETLAEPSAEPTQAEESTSELEHTENNQTMNEQPAETAAPLQDNEPAPEPESEAQPKAETVQENAESQTTEPAATQDEEPTVDYSNRTREELVEDLRELLQTPDITSIKNRVAALKLSFNNADKEAKKAAFDKFIEEGGNKDEYEGGDDAIAESFKKEYSTYRERRQKHIDEIEAQKQKNLEQKQAILEELRKLIDSDNESLKQTYDEFNAIQDRWKAIGDVPRTEINGLWQNYHFLVEQFFGKVRMNKELMLLDQKKNLESKTLLCEKAEELIVETSITKAFKELQSLREQWREIGPVPVEQNDEIWARFRNAANQIDERRKEFYEQRHEEQEKNLLAKQALVEKVNELTAEMPTTAKGWNETSAELDELLKVWKSIGPVPKEQNEEIWNTFKGGIDRFYAEKKQHFESVKDEQTENYNKKIDLCLQAEAIAKREDWKKATDELLKLQEEWKHIGPVNRKVSEKIWQRFRGACDEFFNKKSEYFNALRGSEQENLQKKEAILAELKSYSFGENKDENLDAIKDFQRRWMEVGYVPIAEKQRLQKEFRDTINGLFEQLKISAREAEANAYRERIRSVAGNRQAANGERDNLNEQIQKLRNDINLWENNLGFLASSKQADLLKEEFEKKMQSARQQIALLEAKLKILNETEKAESHPTGNETAADAPETKQDEK